MVPMLLGVTDGPTELHYKSLPIIMKSLVVFFSASFQYKASSNITEHSLPATRSDILRFEVVFFSTNLQYKTSSNINKHSLPAYPILRDIAFI
jgi:hypothetical protein